MDFYVDTDPDTSLLSILYARNSDADSKASGGGRYFDIRGTKCFN
jgi:hypothetical protein